MEWKGVEHKEGGLDDDAPESGVSTVSIEGRGRGRVALVGMGGGKDDVGDVDGCCAEGDMVARTDASDAGDAGLVADRGEGSGSVEWRSVRGGRGGRCGGVGVGVFSRYEEGEEEREWLVDAGR